MKAALEIKDGERLYKAIIQKTYKLDINQRILSKMNADKTIEAVIIIESRKKKVVKTIYFNTKDEFDTSAKIILDSTRTVFEIMFKVEPKYEVFDFSECETVNDQLNLLKKRPDLFNIWENKQNGEKRLVRIDNKFLLDRTYKE